MDVAKLFEKFFETKCGVLVNFIFAILLSLFSLIMVCIALFMIYVFIDRFDLQKLYILKTYGDFLCIFLIMPYSSFFFWFSTVLTWKDTVSGFKKNFLE